MAVVVTAASGFDLGYIWKNQGSRREPERSAGGYYINAAQAGEPPGRWWGPGAEALGFGVGQVVERGPYEQVYRQIDPGTGRRLGRSPGNYAKFADHLARLRAAEPHATAERLLELEREAAQATRQSPVYTDLTVSFSKSISIFHASIRENGRRARLAGDVVEAARWAAIEERYHDVLHAANEAGLEYVQRWAGITRTGYHGTRSEGQEAGRFEAAELIVTSWLQGTSRDGDPQDHIHNQVARLVRTVRDGKHRALDTVCLRQVLGAVQAVVATHAECGLTREFGVAWVPRADGAGNEIAGVTQEQMDAYSSRTVSITGRLPEAVEAWTAKYGREPNQRELLYIRQEVTVASRNGKEHGTIDWDALAAQWDAQLGGELASVAPRVSDLRADARGSRRAAATMHAELTREELTHAVQRALTLTQAAHSTWTRADFLKRLATVLPAHARTIAPEAAVALLDELADEALAGSVDQVLCLESPQWPPLPSYLRRELDGRSVYTRPGTTRYATRVQLSLEEQLLHCAQQLGAPHLNREQAAALLAADPAVLEALLHERASERHAAATGSGLRLDQSAALFHALTSARIVEVITGPAGSGKTRTLAEAARAWIAAGMGDVLGIAAAQAARNVLAAAGVHAAENSSVFLGHLPGRRGALGVRDLRPGTLLVLDEASVMSLPDLAEIVAHAARRGAKVLIAGDQEQLTAVESGGGMMLLARRLGFVQLAEAVRFTAGWEREASLRLRGGDLSVLDEYDEHGRIRGADPEQAIDGAVRRYVSHTLAGRDVLLMIGDRERCREASRRIRDDLIHLGIVAAGPEIELAGRVRASVGDLIICRRNDHGVQTGEPGRTLANGDTLRIEAIRRDRTILVRRALDCDPDTGSRQWAGRAFPWAGYGTADLAYAVTGHSAQGRTVRVGLPVVTGTEDRQWLYVAMTRGAESNVMTVFTHSARAADPKAGTRPAPELARHARVERERAGLPAAPTRPAAKRGPERREAIAVAADILGRDGAESSALETQERALANADHLAVLNAMWRGETAGLEADRFRVMVVEALPAEYAADGLASPQATWLWRTLRAAEAAGLNAAEVVREAVGSRSLSGARDVAAVLDSRLRKMVDPLVPQPSRSWSEQVPSVADPERQRFLTDLAATMDARKERIGEHLAEYPPGWAVRVLGPVPGDPLDRLDWQRRASEVGAYREMYGYDHPGEPIGPEPTGDSPEKRAAWHAAFAVLGPADGVDLRGLADGSLLHMRGTYEAETAWAPRHVGRELRRLRISADDAGLSAIRSQAEERVAGERGQAELAEWHGGLARSWTAMESFYREHEGELEQNMEARREWEQATEATRRLAVAADAELRRRHPETRLEPLRSAEPVVSEEERTQLVLAPGTESYQTPDWISRLAAERRAVRERLDERKAVLVPAAEPDHGYEGEAWPAWVQRKRDAILQPPRPEMKPAPAIAERAAEYEAERE